MSSNKYLDILLKKSNTSKIIFGITGFMYGSVNIIEYYNMKDENKNIKKRLFIISENNPSFNVALSSAFYGTIFAGAGYFPYISVPLLLTCSSYNYIKNNYITCNVNNENKSDENVNDKSDIKDI